MYRQDTVLASNFNIVSTGHRCLSGGDDEDSIFYISHKVQEKFFGFLHFVIGSAHTDNDLYHL
jgi:hypothetical protein